MGGGVWIEEQSNNITITDCYFHSIPGPAILSHWGTGPFYDITIIGNKIYKCTAGIWHMGTGGDWIIENNEIERLYRYGSEYTDSDYIRIFGDNHIIKNNYFHGTSYSEVGTAHVDIIQTFGIDAKNASNVFIELNGTKWK